MILQVFISSALQAHFMQVFISDYLMATTAPIQLRAAELRCRDCWMFFEQFTPYIIGFIPARKQLIYSYYLVFECGAHT